MKNLEKKIRSYALKNALAHKNHAESGAVISSLFHEGLKKEDIKRVSRKVDAIVKEINKLDAESQQREFEALKHEVSERKGRVGLPELPNAKKGVVMRFAPSASGPLHVGHAMTSCISFLYVQKYGGKFFVRIEDTNPENLCKEAYKQIEKDSDWLFKGKAEIVIQSYRMGIYYKYLEKLLRKKAAYVCTCAPEKFREFSKKKKECPCRRLDVSKNILRWKKMLDKKGYKTGEAVVRFRSSMSHKNPAMRDFPLARINESTHPLQKRKYRVWPLMNLAVASDDIEQKMTHIIRAKDHRDNAIRQEMIFRALGKKIPWTAFLGRYKFKDMELSSSKIMKEIKAGKYKGFSDKRLPTISALRKKGYYPEAFYRLAEHMGLSEVDKVISKKDFFKLLDNFNKIPNN